ncbi:MAG: PAS domain S-box protein [Prolixibacteraceae bacterium]|jgi:PAS domain S-box-containing protein|nr:PAS domain S-box protein [Prolixibacteraceae bacterium]
MGLEENKEKLNKIQIQLVDTSLVVASLSAPFLIGLSLIRSFQLNEFGMIFINTIMLLGLIFLTIIRKKISYNLKTIFLISLLFLLAFTDLYGVGYMSMAYIWFAAASILAVLYFDLKRSLIVIFLSLLLILSLYVYKSLGYSFNNYDFNSYANSTIVLVLRASSYVVVCLVVVFSIRHISSNFQANIQLLGKQKLNLLNAAIRMRREMDYRKKSEQIANESENKFKNIFETSSDPMAIIDINGKFLDFNIAFVKLSGETASRLKIIDFMQVVPPEYAEFFEEYRSNLEMIPKRFDLVYTDVNGSVKNLDVTTTVIYFESNKSILTLFRDNTEKINQERNIYSAALEAEERERLRMSKELHDGVGPLLSTLKIYYEALEKRPDDAEIQKRIKNILNDSISSVKEISNNLSPYVLQNLGVVKALRAFIDKIVFAGTLTIRFDSNLEDRIDEKIEITIYRLISEMLNNTIKHADASSVYVSIKIDNLLLKIEYLDNGKGVDLINLKQNSKGIGLFNMRSRIEKMGGKCLFNSEEGCGFQLYAEIELN